MNATEQNVNSIKYKKKVQHRWWNNEIKENIKIKKVEMENSK